MAGYKFSIGQVPDVRKGLIKIEPHQLDGVSNSQMLMKILCRLFKYNFIGTWSDLRSTFEPFAVCHSPGEILLQGRVGGLWSEAGLSCQSSSGGTLGHFWSLNIHLYSVVLKMVQKI